MLDLNTVHHGDCLDVLKTMPDNSIDSIVTDPPYGLNFMGKKWDYDVPSEAIWRECLRVLKPGGHLVSFAGSRTYHRMAVRVEDAGFEIRDQLMWIYGSGFPKSLDVSKAIDKAAGAEREVIGENPNHRPESGVEYAGVYAGANTGAATVTAPATDAAKQWDGWGTALKPSHEPIVLARKPFPGTVAANVQQHGTGGLNIGACRIGTSDADQEAMQGRSGKRTEGSLFVGKGNRQAWEPTAAGRWPANLLLEDCPEVLAGFPTTTSGTGAIRKSAAGLFGLGGDGKANTEYGGTGSAARFFYCGKATKKDREEGNGHPTVKPTAVMRWLCRLITPPGGVVLDPFTGSGSTGKAAVREGFDFIGIEREAEYVAIARARVAAVQPALALY